jgi:UDP-N-acetylmuramoyl-L-alanyl-D-glutamate--2,6-diaminopimelate ligase
MLPYRLTMHPFVRRIRRRVKSCVGLAIAFAFGMPSRRLRVVGVTGTTGKTTTIHFIATALESAGYTVGMVSSIEVRVGTRRLKNVSGLTSLGLWQTQKLLAHMVRAGCSYAVLEVSSHAADQSRLAGVMVDVAVITNLSRDHLDYHRTIEDYTAAKRRLFSTVSQRRPKYINDAYVPRVLVAALDDPKTRPFLDEPSDIKFGLQVLNSQLPTPGGVEPVNLYSIRAGKERTQGVVMVRGENALLYLNLPGRFQVRNALCAVAVGVSQDISAARVTRALMDIRGIPGRFEPVDAGQPFQVVVDYAVTEAALASLYQTLMGFRPKRILAVFGACGDRDRGKRAGMARIVGKYAARVFLTNEDPFTEDPQQIFADLEVGLKQAGVDYVVIPDRMEAIRAAVKEAKEGDIVVATGKGAEETMRFADKTIPWSDKGVFEQAIQEVYG